MRALVLHNPDAGDGAHGKQRLVKALEAAGYSTDYYVTGDPSFEAALASEPALVVVVGGDGTISKLLSYSIGIHTPVAIVPLGTANNIATSLGIEGKAKHIIAGLTKGVRRRLDIGNAIGPWGRRPFLESVGVGVMASAMVGAPLPPGPAMLRAARLRLRDIVAGAEPCHADVEIDGRPVSGAFLMIECTSLPRLGPALELSPRSAPGDRLLDVVLLPAERRAAMRNWLGNGLGVPPVDIGTGRLVAIRWDRAPLRIDDRQVRVHPGAKTMTVRLQPMGLTVIVPRMARRRRIRT